VARSKARRQLISEALNGGQGAVMSRDYTTPCPKRGGPERPHPDHPGKIGFGTCSGCKYDLGLFFRGTVCTHPKARQVSAQAMAEAVKEEEGQQQPSLF
jgi:hypothetical protein